MLDTRTALPVAALLSILAVASSASAIAATRQSVAATWVLHTGHNIPARLPQRPQMTFEKEKLSGSTGCNAFTAKVTERENKRVSIAQVALTRKLCAPKQNQIEAALVHALEQTEFIDVQTNRLSFLSAKREPLLIWTRKGKPAARRHKRCAHRGINNLPN